MAENKTGSSPESAQHTETLEMVKELNRVAELIHFHGLNSASQTSLINLLHKSAQRLELLAKEVEVMRGDKERLDWLQHQRYMDEFCVKMQKGSNIRHAIDAARKESTP